MYIKKIIYSLLIISLFLSGCKKQEEPTPDTENPVDYSSYAGLWEGDGAYLVITVDNPEIMVVDFENDDNLIFSESLFVSSIKNNKAKVAFTDTWGVSGTLIITFKDEMIKCQIKDIVDNSEYSMSPPESTHKLTRSENKDDSVEETYIPPTYDTSKASGILAQLGMTEEQFRNSCKNLNSYKYPEIDYYDLLEYPNQHIGMHVTDFMDTSSGVVMANGFNVDIKGVSDDGYIYYIDQSKPYRLVFDFRDDPYSPTISEGKSFIPCMIFDGVKTLNGTDYLCFKLISIDTTRVHYQPKMAN